MNKKLAQLRRQSGFTLVELLIVIALIGILSVAVLATINPIEQTNKARDAKYKNDAAEVLGALERYYAANNQYPFQNDPLYDVSSLPKYLSNSTSVYFGVGESTGIAGPLITTSELKSSFFGKEPFANNNSYLTVPINNQMYGYFNGSDSNYVCFCPKARANFDATGGPAKGLKCIMQAAGPYAAASNVLIDIGGGCNTAPPTITSNSCSTGVGATAQWLCVPEGSIR